MPGSRDRAQRPIDLTIRSSPVVVNPMTHRPNQFSSQPVPTDNVHGIEIIDLTMDGADTRTPKSKASEIPDCEVFPFMKLSLEIQTMICRYRLLAKRKPHQLPHTTRAQIFVRRVGYKPRYHLDVSILYVSKHLSMIGTQILYGQNDITMPRRPGSYSTCYTQFALDFFEPIGSNNM